MKNCNTLLCTLILMLSFHCTSAKIIYVSEQAVGVSGPLGTTWQTAYLSLEDALCASNLQDADEIWVAEGTYTSDLDENCVAPADSRQSTFFIDKRIKVYGGFAHGETVFNMRDQDAYPTILSGGDAINNANNNYHVVTIKNTDCIFDGFIIENGNADGAGILEGDG